MPPTSAFGLLSASRLVLILLLVWLLALMLFFMIPFYTRSETEMIISNDSNGKNDLIVARLNRASLELNSLRAQNTQLRELIDTIRSPDASSQIKNPPVNGLFVSISISPFKSIVRSITVSIRWSQMQEIMTNHRIEIHFHPRHLQQSIRMSGRTWTNYSTCNSWPRSNRI